MEITKEELEQMLSKKPTFAGRKIGKWTTTILLILLFMMGVFGSFNKVDFNMISFTAFLDSFKYYFGVIAGAVGVGTTAKTIMNGIVKQEEMKSSSNNHLIH